MQISNSMARKQSRASTSDMCIVRIISGGLNLKYRSNPYLQGIRVNVSAVGVEHGWLRISRHHHAVHHYGRDAIACTSPTHLVFIFLLCGSRANMLWCNTLNQTHACKVGPSDMSTLKQWQYSIEGETAVHKAAHRNPHCCISKTSACTGKCILRSRSGNTDMQADVSLQHLSCACCCIS